MYLSNFFLTSVKRRCVFLALFIPSIVILIFFPYFWLLLAPVHVAMLKLSILAIYNEADAIFSFDTYLYFRRDGEHIVEKHNVKAICPVCKSDESNQKVMLDSDIFRPWKGFNGVCQEHPNLHRFTFNRTSKKGDRIKFLL